MTAEETVCVNHLPSFPCHWGLIVVPLSTAKEKLYVACGCSAVVHYCDRHVRKWNKKKVRQLRLIMFRLSSCFENGSTSGSRGKRRASVLHRKHDENIQSSWGERPWIRGPLHQRDQTIFHASGRSLRLNLFSFCFFFILIYSIFFH